MKQSLDVRFKADCAVQEEMGNYFFHMVIHMIMHYSE